VSKILASILAIQRDIHSVGVGKLRQNKEQNFKFRGIDDALQAFAPRLSEHNVVLAPAFQNVTTEARQTKSGGSTYNVKLEGVFKFIHAEDGSEHIVGPVYGEANDGQDKAVSKAESIAMRQALFLAFCVPHEPVIGGDPDGIGEEEGEVPAYADWTAAIDERADIASLRLVKAEMVAKFGQVPAVLVEHYNQRVEALKKAAP
jgi:hypothetical protein